MKREFIYMKPFEKNWNDLGLTDSDLEELETRILTNPDTGDIIQGTGGLRKMRYALANKGKSGGARILYVDFVSYEQIYFINIYPKNSQENITDKEKQLYKQIIDATLKHLKGAD